MRDLLTDKETAKILGKRIDRLYKDVDFFDKYDDDEWELNEGEHFEFVARTGVIKERRFYEEGVEALARYYEKDQSGIFGRFTRFGIFFLMVSFGASFGFAVMGRISLLIGRFNDLIDYSSPDYNYATFYVLLFIIIVLGFWSFKNREK